LTENAGRGNKYKGHKNPTSENARHENDGRDQIAGRGAYLPELTVH